MVRPLIACLVLLVACEPAAPAAPTADPRFMDGITPSAQELDLLRTVHAAGFTVHEVRRSKLEALFEATDHAWFVGTGAGPFEVVFFPGPTDAERIGVCETQIASGYRYQLTGARSAGGAEPTMEGRRIHFLARGPMLVLASDEAIAGRLRQALDARVPICARAGGPAPGVLPSVANVPCDETPTTTERPSDANTAAWSALWYVSADRQLWASAYPRGWRMPGEKVLWAKPPEARLDVSGRRLDGPGQFHAGVPCCYDGLPNQASGIAFSDAGCWEIVGRAGTSELRIVVRVPHEIGAVYAASREDPSWGVIGATWGARGPIRLHLLADDGNRVTASEDRARVGAAWLPNNTIARLRPDDRGYPSHAPVAVDLLDALTLQVTRSFPIALPVGQYDLVWFAGSDELLIVGVQEMLRLRMSSGELLGRAQVPGSGSLPPLAARRLQTDLVMLGGLCLERGGCEIVFLGRDGEIQRRLATPAQEPDAPYAHIPDGPLFVGIPSRMEVAALDASDGAVRWRTTLVEGATPSRAKRIGSANQILVSRDASTLYVIESNASEGSLGVFVVDARSGALRATRRPKLTANGIALSRDERYLFVAAREDGGSVVAIDMRSGDQIRLATGLGDVVGVLVTPGR